MSDLTVAAVMACIGLLLVTSWSHKPVEPVLAIGKRVCFERDIDEWESLRRHDMLNFDLDFM